MDQKSKSEQSRNEDMALAIGAKKLHEGRQFMYDAAKAYHDTFKDLSTGLYRQEFLETRSCPVCKSNASKQIFTADGGVYVKCEPCEMVYLNPVFKDDALTKFYQNNNEVQSQVVSNEGDFYRIIYQKGLDAITRTRSSGQLLDVGCSSGTFLDLARTAGWQTSGTDLNKAEVKVAISKGHKIYPTVESIDSGQKFDAISLWDVFEHIKDGHRFLTLLKHILAPGGVIFMQIPSAGSLAARIMHDLCKMFDGLEHVNLYSPSTIKKVTEANGFELKSIESVISEIPVIANYLGYESPYLGTVDHHKKILGLIDEETLHQNLLGYKLQVVMQSR